MVDAIRVLHVDDDAGYGELVADFLEREGERFEVTLADSAAAALERIERERPDCIVSDFEMPGRDGIEFLQAVRAEYPRLPFILFTGKGSEEVASDAISAGATDYLQKQSGTDQYKLLANRIGNAVEQYRSRQELERERSRMQFALESTEAVIWTLDVATEAMEIYPTVCPLFQTRIESFAAFLNQVRPEDRSRVRETVRAAARAGESYSVQFRYPANGETRWGEMTGRSIREDGEVSFQTGITRDITTQKKRKRRFETLTSNLPGMVYRCRNEPDWPMEDVRGDVAAFSGYTAAQLETGEVEWGRDVIHPDERDEVWTAVQEALEDRESFELTYRIVDAEGETRWVWERGRGIYGPEGELVALEGFVTDITDRKQRERELRRNERRFESMFDDPNILVGLLEVDGTVIDINETAMAYVDADLDQVVGRPFPETPWWQNDDVSDLERWIDRAADGEYVEFEAEHQTPDGDVLVVEGTVRPVVDGGGDVVSLIVSARDITERRRHEAELETVRDRMEFALRRSDSVIWESDPEAGSVTSYPDPCPLYERPVRTTEAFYAGVYEADRPAVEAAFDDARETGEPQSVAFRTAPDVGTEWIECRIRPLIEDGSVSRLVGVSRDITEYKRRERQLERQNERFDQLASVVSHDLETPISTVRGRLQLAVETSDLSHVEDAQTAIQRLDELRRDLVEMLRTREIVGETERLDVSELATAAWEGINRPADSTLELTGDPVVDGDPDATKRLLQNLLSNAVEHAEGHTSVRVGPCDGGFYVEDDGPGIDPGHREEVFTPGFSTKSGGTGMGMASVKQIADEHGWEFDITEPETLGGVRFEITC